uniref:Uncharacterized protein n=1 Tax=Avena sativa TaxID=4498 RepID=A0ACD5TF58_AVESA
MEAIAYGQQAYRLANELQISEVYLIRGLGFQTADMPPQFGLAISTNFYVVMHSWTQVHLAGPNISIPVLPSQFMDFDDAARLRDKMLTGAYCSLFKWFTLCVISYNTMQKFDCSIFQMSLG